MNRVQVGDSIEVETADGSSYRFEVTAMDETTLSSRDAVYEYSEIQRLQIQQRNRDSSEALGMVGAVLLVILGIALIAAGSATLVFLIGRQLFSRKVGILAGLIYAIYGTLMLYEAMLLIPVVYIFLILLGIYRMIQLKETYDLKSG